MNRNLATRMKSLLSILRHATGPRPGLRQVLVIIFSATLAGSAHAQTIVRELSAEDYVEILNLYCKYPLLLDTGDGEGFAGLFTEDGSFGARVTGREALIEFASRQPSTVRHAPLTPMIVPTAEGARGVVMNLFIDVSESPAVITRVSQYTDTLVKTSAGWRFKSRVNGTADITNPGFTTGAPGD
ncbi:nuclear transport factor 2 family protein [Candidatus Neomarinimicrobiota bacterium]